MSKQQRKGNFEERDEQARHYFNQRKKRQDKKLLRNIDRALRNKDYTQLMVRSDEY